jgi:hypothetical protein
MLEEMIYKQIISKQVIVQHLLLTLLSPNPHHIAPAYEKTDQEPLTPTINCLHQYISNILVPGHVTITGKEPDTGSQHVSLLIIQARNHINYSNI